MQMRRAGLAGLLLGLLLSGPLRAEEPGLVAEFHDAVAIGDTARVRQMLAQDPALADSAGEFGFRPIQLLDLYFDAEILDLLLSAGADINGSNDEGVTLLHIVTDPEAVPLLVAKGANLEARDARGWTPLIMQTTSQENGPDVVIALLKAGADREARGENGMTALDLAREGGSDELLRVLEGE